jgi:two-component system NarL family sensor kinase
VEPARPGGAPTIQNLIAVAKQGGGWCATTGSSRRRGVPAPKLGYVVAIPDWGWIMGTGLYLDDVEAALAKVDAQQSRNIEATMWWIAGLAILSALVVGSSGLALNVSESREADAKLKALAQRVVDSQEQERARCRATCTTASASGWSRSSCRSRPASSACRATPGSRPRRAPPSSAPPRN